MNFSIKNISILILLAALSGFSGCDYNPTGTESKSYSNISVFVLDELGMPLEGIKVVTYPKTFSLYTDKDGHALFEGIETGRYQVVASRSDIPIFFKGTFLTKYKEEEMTFVVASIVSINVVVKDISGQPISNIEVRTSPNTSSEISDENGFVTFKNVPIREYIFLVTRNNAVAYVRNKTLAIVDGKIKDIEIVIDNEKPTMNIIAPENNKFQNIFDVRFIGEGFDFEDGELPDNTISWHSSIDGELGTGKDITIDRMSVGKHTITLTGIDSNQNISHRRINLNLFFFEDDSYFPIPWEGNWKYRHQNPVFTIINTDGTQEIWMLEDMDVLMKSINSRNSLMRYSIQTELGMKYCEYYVIDYYETDYYDTDLDNIYVSKTSEKYKIWDKHTNDYNPISQMNIELNYNPRMLIIKNHMDPLSVSSYESNTTIDVTWRFDREYLYSRNYTETLEIVNSVEIGGMETVETDIGTYEAAVITVTQGETVRKWWLAKGIGIVRFDYNTLDSPVTSLLYETNISKFSDDGYIHKNISNSTNYGGNQIQKVLKSPPGTPEKTLEIIEILRGLSPR